MIFLPHESATRGMTSKDTQNERSLKEGMEKNAIGNNPAEERKANARPAAVVVLIVLEVVLAFLGFASGTQFLLDPSGETHGVDVSMLEGLPVGDHALVGLLFVTAHGILPVLATYGLWKLPRW